jgi:hypothetical protein
MTSFVLEDKMPRKQIPLEQRFWSRVIKTGDCWLWENPKKSGYGEIKIDGKMEKAHIISYRMDIGPVPKGLELDHLCRNRSCVRPDHLEAVTHIVNVRRGLAGAYNKIKTNCRNGHPFSGENLRIRPNGKRNCRACYRKYALKSYHQKRGSNGK